MQYGQFFPVAKAAGILGERWTLLVIRELLLGTARFSELQRALAKASPTTLAKRLKELEQAGIVTHVQRSDHANHEYRLTRAGRALGAVIDDMGVWAARWMPGTLSKVELDEYYLVLDMSRRIAMTELPVSDVTLGFRFRNGTGTPDWWLVVRDRKVDICDRGPGYDLDLLIAGSLRLITEIWLGKVPLAQALTQRRLKVEGNRTLERTFRHWWPSSAYARPS